MSPTTVASVHEHRTLVVGDLTLEVAPPGERKTIEIVVERDASLVLKAPHGVSAERATQFVTDKRTWIYRKLAEKDALTGPPIVKRFVEGEGFAYLGRSYRLTLTEPAGGLLEPARGDPSGSDRMIRRTRAGQARQAELSGVRLDRGRFHLSATEADRGATAMRRWYTHVGGQWLRRRIRPWAARLGENTARVEVRDLGYRWGSARPIDGPQRINVHWATLQLPPSLIDYVLVHELAHLRETNHTPDFWNTVNRVMPGYEHHKANLATIGKNIWLGAVVEP